MTNNECTLIEIVEVLCDCICALPCGCDICSYAESMDENGKCEVHQFIGKVKKIRS